MKNAKIYFILTIVLIGVKANLFAYNLRNCPNIIPPKPVIWSNKTVTFRAHSSSFPSGNAYRSALSAVAARWNAAPSLFTYQMQFDDNSTFTGNRENEIWFGTDPGAPAVTFLWWDNACNITETDIIFDNAEHYTPSTNKIDLVPYGGSFRPFQTTAMHEFGHAQGLLHTSDTYSIMGQDWDHIYVSGSTTTAYPGEDAVSGSIAAYGVEPGREDLGLSHWRRTGASGEYSVHNRTRVLDMNNNTLPVTNQLFDPTYSVNVGQTVKLELTYENMGTTSSVTVQVKYYFSADNVITSSDKLLATGSVTLTRNKPDTFTAIITVPDSPFVMSGMSGYLGAIIDSSNAVNETYESNNTTYVPIKFI
jgi:hypothetical protein